MATNWTNAVPEHFWKYVFLGHIQNTSQLLIYVAIFALLTAPPILELLHARKIQDRSANPVVQKKERFLFWRNILLIPLISTPIWLLLHSSNIISIQVGLHWQTILWQVIFGIVIHDAYFYWTHRILHNPAIYGKAHVVHHTFVSPTVYASHAFDWWEVLINFTYIIYLSLVFQLFSGHVSAEAILLFLAFANLYNIYGHSGHEFVPQRIRKSTVGSWFSWVGYHDLHHEKNNGNFGLYFTMWDRLCGTVSPDWDFATATKKKG